MNKQKGIIIGVLALAVTMMVGYALFSETITINGTATAKGDFSLAATCEKGFSEKINIKSNTWAGLPEVGYENDSCSVNDNIVDFHADLKYPGAARYFTIKVTNTGTIDALLNIDTGIEYLKNKFCYDSSNNGIIEEDECDNNRQGLIGVEPIAFEKTDGTVLNAYDDDLSDFADGTGNLIIEPGESFYFYALAVFDEIVGNYDNTNSFFATQEMSVKLNFTQKVTN